MPSENTMRADKRCFRRGWGPLLSMFLMTPWLGAQEQNPRQEKQKTTEAQPAQQAQPKANPQNADAPQDPKAVCKSANVLSAIACELRLQLPGELGEVLVVSGAVEHASRQPLSELSRRLAEVVSGRFDSAKSGGPLSLEQARARRTGAAYLLYLNPKLNGAHFEVTADLFAVQNSFWDRFKEPPGPLHHVFASRRIDAEVGSFLPVPKLVGQVEHKARLPTRDVVALACGDADGDRGLELLLHSRHQVYVGRIRTHRFVTERSVSWQELSPVAGAPLQQPIGSLQLKAEGGVLVGLSDRHDLVELDRDLRVTARSAGQQPWGDLGCARRKGLGLEPVVVECGGTRTWEQLDVATEVDAVAGGTFPTRRGLVRVVAARGLGQGVLQLSDSDGRQAQLPGSGAQLALSDLNLDGVLEIISSKDTLDPTQDALRVHSWTEQGLQLVYELPVPTGVDAVCACPAEGEVLSRVVVSTGDELWLLR